MSQPSATIRRYPALYFDAEAKPNRVVDHPLFPLWMLIPAAAMILMITWWIAVDGVAPYALKVWFSLGLAAVWIWLFVLVRRLASQDRSRYVELLAGAIDVHVCGWYETLIPFAAIDRIELRRRYTLRDAIAESFTLAGRIPERGEHVAICCTRLIAFRNGGVTWPFLPFRRRRTFRVKLADGPAFVAVANEALAAWRRERPRAGPTAPPA